MMEPFDTITRAGFTASIYQDEDASSPDDWDAFGTLAYDARRASWNRCDLPSDPYGNGRFVDDCERCEGTGKIDVRVANGTKAERWACPGGCKGTGTLDGEAICRRMHGAVAVLPVYAYDGQDGTVLEVADDWSQANGWIYATQESADMTGVPPESYLAALEQELATWRQYFAGDVFGVVVTDPQGSEVDSCWGFYGFDYAMDEARGMLDIEPVRLLEANPDLANLTIN